MCVRACMHACVCVQACVRTYVHAYICDIGVNHYTSPKKSAPSQSFIGQRKKSWILLQYNTKKMRAKIDITTFYNK